MGQQQLLLLVLATVIVGLATVAGIQAFEQGSLRAKQDALTSTAVKIASDIQARVREPSQFGGYDGDISDSGAKNSITLEEMSYETSSGVYSTVDGDCAIVNGGGNNALSVDDGDLSKDGPIDVLCESSDIEVVANVGGLDSEDISTNAAVDQTTDLGS